MQLNKILFLILYLIIIIMSNEQLYRVYKHYLYLLIFFNSSNPKGSNIKLSAHHFHEFNYILLVVPYLYVICNCHFNIKFIALLYINKLFYSIYYPNITPYITLTILLKL